MTGPDATCVFCEIVAGRSPATVVSEWGDTIAIVPLCPVTDGHVLLIPREHVADPATDPFRAAATMYRASQYAADRDQPFNLIASAGREATQSVFHLHVHYVPRAADDLLMLPWGTLHGEDPKAPHRCKGMARLEQELADAAR